MPTVYPFRFSNLTRLGCGLVGSNRVRTYLPSARISTSKRSPGLAWRRVTRCLLSAMAVILGELPTRNLRKQDFLARNPLDRQGRFVPQPGSAGQLAGVAAPASGQLGLLSAPARQLLRDDGDGPLLGGLPVEFPGLALAKLTLHQLQQPSPVQACTSAAGRLQLYAKGLMEPLSGLMAVPRRSPSVGPPPFAPAVQRWAE